jgi:hypothetical protein
MRQQLRGLHIVPFAFSLHALSTSLLFSHPHLFLQRRRLLDRGGPTARGGRGGKDGRLGGGREGGREGGRDGGREGCRGSPCLVGFDAQGELLGFRHDDGGGV